MKITKRSSLTGHYHTMHLDVTEAQLDAWQQGELIQNAMPQLSADEREFLLNGITAKEWQQFIIEDASQSEEEYVPLLGFEEEENL